MITSLFSFNCRATASSISPEVSPELRDRRHQIQLRPDPWPVTSVNPSTHVYISQTCGSKVDQNPQPTPVSSTPSMITALFTVVSYSPDWWQPSHYRHASPRPPDVSDRHILSRSGRRAAIKSPPEKTQLRERENVTHRSCYCGFDVSKKKKAGEKM